jgi:hypothetical protein
VLCRAWFRWLRTQTNKHKRPFQEETIIGYAREIDGDFTACDTAVLNEFFAAYRDSHTQGGTNTRQRNLHHLFTWLVRRYDHPDPWTPDLVRYVAAMAADLDAAMRLAVDGLRRAGYSWGEIAAPLGVTRQGAQQRWGQRTGTSDLRVDQDPECGTFPAILPSGIQMPPGCPSAATQMPP